MHTHLVASKNARGHHMSKVLTSLDLRVHERLLNKTPRLRQWLALNFYHAAQKLVYLKPISIGTSTRSKCKVSFVPDG